MISTASTGEQKHQQRCFTRLCSALLRVVMKHVRMMLALLGFAFCMAAHADSANHSLPDWSIAFDSESRAVRLSNGGNVVLCTSALANTDAGVFVVGEHTPRIENSTTTGVLGGLAISIREKVTTAGVALTLMASQPRNLPGMLLELQLVNESSKSLSIHSLSPLFTPAGSQNESRLDLSRAQSYSKVLTNGRMYHDPGRLLDLAPGAKPFDSFFDAALYDPSTSRTVVIGYVNGHEFEPHVLGCETSSGLQLEATGRAESLVQLAPGKSVSSGSVIVLFRDNPFDVLEQYADTLAAYHHVHLNPIINGWCTWSNMYGDITEERVLKNARVIASQLKSYGMEWVQIDDGYERAFGDWEAISAKLPHGMKDLASKITALGLKPGIWLAPFAISRGTEIATSHTDWLVHTPDGKLQEIESAHQQQAQYILDVSQPGALQWLHRTVGSVVREWGYRFVKTDFCEWTLMATQQFADPSFSTAKAYFVANREIRSAIGPGVHLLDCGPTPEIIGLADSMRIELDRPVAADCSLWDQYALHYNSTGPAVAKRYYFHGRTWINDADHIRMVGLDLPQAQVAASITALSGGTMISGDQLYDLDADRMDILKKVFPSSGKCARPIDLFETTQPALFVCPFNTSAGNWSLVGVFNWSDTTATRVLSHERLGFKPGTPWLAFDFWDQKLVANELQDIVVDQAPRSCNVLSVRERLGRPQLVGTNRHLTQGAIELKDVKWNAASRQLSGTALGAPGMDYDLFIFVPENYHTNLAEQVMPVPGSRNLARVKIRFPKANSEDWLVSFSERQSTGSD